jgi:hypothetical protein
LYAVAARSKTIEPSAAHEGSSETAVFVEGGA